MKRPKLRVAADILLLLLFFCALGGVVWFYWFRTDPTRTPANVVLESDPGGIDLPKLLEMVRTTPAAAALPEWNPAGLSNRWQYIAIHHSATLSGNAGTFETAHRQRGMENGMAYHFVIDNGHGGEDGFVEVGTRWQKQLDGGHLHGDSLNKEAIGICLVGDFTQSPPTPKQIASLKALLKQLIALTQITPDKILGHKRLPEQSTACPGLLPLDILLQNL